MPASADVDVMLTKRSVSALYQTPEPSTFALIAAGLAAMTLRRRCRAACSKV
jgi:hypothetical protein